MNSTLNKIQDGQIEATIELGKEDLDAFVNKAEKLLGQEFETKGFRKGKVPNDILRKELGAERILETALEIAVRESLASVIEKESLDVLDTSGLDIKENSPQKLVYKVLLTTYPQISIADLGDLKIQKREQEITEEETVKALDSIRSNRAKYSDKEGKAEKGDRVEVDFEVSSEGKVIDEGVSKNHPLIIGNGGFIPGFEDNLVGMGKGESKSFSLIAPTDYYAKDIAGKKLDFKVQMVDIKKVEKPEVDEEFLASLGSFTSLEELKGSIKDNLKRGKEEKEKQRIRLEILGAIIEKSKIKPPVNMVDRQLEIMIQNFDEELHASGLELGPYLTHISKTIDDLKKDWRKNAERQVQIALILHKVAKDNNFLIDDAELDLSVNQVAQSLISKDGLDKKNLDLGLIRENLRSRMLNDLALAHLEKLYSV
jgi:trigger factor